MKYKRLIEKLQTKKENILRVETKRLKAFDQLRVIRKEHIQAQIQLDKVNTKYQRKVKTYTLLDKILAEVRFETQRQEEAQEAQAARAKRKTNKTAEQIKADALACLKALPKDQQEMIIKTFQQPATLKE